jgi:hypothetical protein
MPLAAPVVAALVTGAAGTATTIYAVRAQKKAQEKAAKEGKASVDEQIALERERMAEDRRVWEEEQALLKQQFDASQRQAAEDLAEQRWRWESGEANAEPYREAGYSALSALTGRAGLPTPGPRVKPAPPSHLVEDTTPKLVPGTTDPVGTPRNTTMWDSTALPVMLSDTAPTMTPDAYARIATSPEALSQMTPEERELFTQEAMQVPIGALMTRPSTGGQRRRL